MPLTHSSSKEALQTNIAQEMKTKPAKQAEAIGYSIQREARKDGSQHPVRAIFDEVLKQAREHYGRSDSNENHDPHSGQFASGGEASSGASQKQVTEKTKISKEKLLKMFEGKPSSALHAALKNPNVDAGIKKHIEKELDNRATRGA